MPLRPRLDSNLLILCAASVMTCGQTPQPGPERLDAGPPFIMDGGSPGDLLDAGSSTDAGSESPDAMVSDSGAPPSDAGARPLTPPTSAGPFALSTVSATVTRGSRQTPVVAHLPATGQPAPLVVFLAGAQLKTSMYLPTVERLASHGFIVVRADPSLSLLAPNHQAMADDVRAVIDWALSPAGPLAGKVDGSRLGVAGHSLGGKLATMTAFGDSRVKALFGIDPVDAQNPDVAPDQVRALRIPVGFAGETVDGAGGVFGMPCAPSAGNYTQFYDAASQAPWSAEWTFADVNHMAFVDACSGLPCGVCNAATGDVNQARASLRTLVVAFFRLHLQAEAGVAGWLTGANVPPGLTVRSR